MDWNFLMDLFEDRDLAWQMANDAVIYINNQMPVLKTAITNKNLEDVADLAHKIKGVSCQFGMKHASEIASEMESKAESKLNELNECANGLIVGPDASVMNFPQTNLGELYEKLETDLTNIRSEYFIENK